MTNEQDRMTRLHFVKGLIEAANKKGKPVIKEKLIGTLGIQYGLSRRTVLDYVKTLISAELVKEEGDGELWLI